MQGVRFGFRSRNGGERVPKVSPQFLRCNASTIMACASPAVKGQSRISVDNKPSVPPGFDLIPWRDGSR